MIPKDTIQTIIETARVEEVVGDFVNLKKRGVNYIGLCPFHNEKTPSFTVSPTKGIYKCFGCGKAGNSVGFIMEHEHYSYPEALKYVAKKYNIEIEEEEQTPEQIQELNEKESLYAVSAYAQKFFSNQLNDTEEGKAIGLTYFKEREFTLPTIEKFQLGYSPDAWDAFTKDARGNGYEKKFMVNSGLTIEKDGKLFDRFRARVIFPIHNLSGRVIGYGGRILTSDKKKPKYVNSPESDIYNKSKVLYGIYFAKSAIIKNDNCLLVEGYTDVISLHQAGIENVVSSSGTSLTTDQIRLIKRYTSNITILYDGDEAGLKASFRGIDMILEQGMNVKIVMFPEGEDPDSFARTHRTIEVEDFLSRQAKDFIQFKTSILLDEAKNDPIKKAGLIKEIVQSISLIPDGIIRSIYVKECSSLMQMAEQTLMNELNKKLRAKFRSKTNISFEEEPEVTEYTAEQEIEVDFSDTTYQEKDLMRILLSFGNQSIELEEKDDRGHMVPVSVNVAEFIIHDLQEDELELKDPVYKTIFNEYADLIEKDESPDEKYFIFHQDKEIAQATSDLVIPKYTLSDQWEERKIYTASEAEHLFESIERAILSFKAKKIEQLIGENQQEIKREEDEENMLILMKKQIDLKRISNDINQKLSRIITR